MERPEKLKLVVGIFIIIITLLFIVIMLWLSANKFYKKGQYYLTYFDESIQGLEVASPVKYRGINVGRVAKIDIAQNSRYIEVLMEINKDFQVQDNIIAQLKSVGITGFIYVELNLYDEEKKNKLLVPPFKTAYKVIPSIPSDLGQIMENLGEIAYEFKSMGLSDITKNIKEILNNINDKLKVIDTAKIQYKINKLIDQMDKTAKAFEKRINQSEALFDNVNKSIIESNNNFNNLLKEFKQAIISFNNIINNTNNIVLNNSDKINYFFSELSASIEKFNDILNKIEDQPSLIFSKPPIKRSFKQ